MDLSVLIADRHVFARRKCMCTEPAHGSVYSALILAARITLAHFSVSSAISLPKSAGEPASGGPPSSSSRDLTRGSAKAALTSLLSLSTISIGVALGAAMPHQLIAS